ncbi:MAG: sigma-54 dependent transcriptional regulator, partial [Gemmatimonadota bacterium]|nr:sigma-54 dependent transcriptional regulator [Gemmatimonadota bacterium]
ASLSEARDVMTSQRFDAVLLDMVLPDGKGLDLISEVRQIHQDTAIVVITGQDGGIPLAVEAIKEGADNFLTKPVSLANLSVILEKSLELGTLRRSQLATQRVSKKTVPFFGQTPAMKRTLELARLACENDSAVILQGETGTGKGVLARWIHDHGPDSSSPFIEINCSGLKGELLSSELFGHAKGAFTSATQDKPGLIEVADGGTLFLDEIGDMAPGVQAEFLKVIEEKHFRRLGEVTTRRSEFRLICSTNQDLQEKIRDGSFRRDLFFRINVFLIHLPPLRERLQDLPELAGFLLNTLGAPDAQLGEGVIERLKSYYWPGNVREMRNVLERALLLARKGVLESRYFTFLESPEPQSDTLDRVLSLEQMERNHIISVMNRFHQDTRAAAETLGISLATLYRKLKKITREQPPPLP